MRRPSANGVCTALPSIANVPSGHMDFGGCAWPMGTHSTAQVTVGMLREKRERERGKRQKWVGSVREGTPGAAARRGKRQEWVGSVREGTPGAAARRGKRQELVGSVREGTPSAAARRGKRQEWVGSVREGTPGAAARRGKRLGSENAVHVLGYRRLAAVEIAHPLPLSPLRRAAHAPRSSR
eukprot:365561-Chlamydomonas_euryale.AAC.3